MVREGTPGDLARRPEALRPALATPELSIVIPTYNEAESLPELHRRLTEVMAQGSYEILFVDDGSSDGSWEWLGQCRAQDPRVRGLRFPRNFGKAEALAAGFAEARGPIIITLDADLQDDPSEIPRFLALIAEGYDLVNGWKVRRQDPLAKRLPSRLFNGVTSWVTGLHLHDYNCGFKAYRRQVVERLQVYGEQHRFIPAMAHWQGFRVAELPVRHHARRHGRSKYGVRRFWAGLMDLLTILFLTRFRGKPLHLFGSMGVLCFAVGFLINLYLTALWFQGERIGNRPLLLLGVLLLVMGVQFFSIGLLGEMMTLSSRARSAPHPYYQGLEEPSPSPGAAAPAEGP